MKKHQNNRTRKAAIAILAGLAVTGIIGASAATLGGINSGQLGAEVDVIGSCDNTGVNVAYAASYNATVKGVGLNRANISAVSNACDGLAYEVTVTDSTGAALGTATGTVPVDPVATEFDASFTGVDAAMVDGIAITIFGS